MVSQNGNLCFSIFYCLFILIIFPQNGNGNAFLCRCRLEDNKRVCVYVAPSGTSTCAPHYAENLKIESSGDFVPLVESFRDDSYSFVSYLDLSENEIKRMNLTLVEPFNFVFSLDLSHNQIVGFDSGSRLSFKFVNLNKLILNHNKISTLDAADFGKMDHLATIDLSFNRINRFLGQFNITNLYLKRNNLSNINNTFLENFKLLKNISLEDNNLSEIDVDLFSNLPDLLHVRLSYNQITHLHPKTFNNLKALINLELQYNQLSNLDSKLLHNLGNLESINLSHNNLKSISDGLFAALPRLRYLNISYNRITNISSSSFQDLELLEILAVNNNPLESLDSNEILSELTNLKALHF